MQTALDNNDYDTLKTKLDALQKAAQAMGEAMYQQQAQQQQDTHYDGSANSYDDNVMDADFTEK